jgi:hypothetical protein
MFLLGTFCTGEILFIFLHFSDDLFGLVFRHILLYGQIIIIIIIIIIIGQNNFCLIIT